MKRFEATWRCGFEHYERVLDTQTGQSLKRRIDLKYEWYTPSSTGLYTFILDDEIRLERKQGNAKQGREHYGFMDPMYRNIRDNYWNKDAYNLEPRVFFLDIETRMSRSYKHTNSPNKKLKIRKKE
jgi:hypothetical protein